jgi:flagellar biosynthesis/type III secretory pathway chaperone
MCWRRCQPCWKKSSSSWQPETLTAICCSVSLKIKARCSVPYRGQNDMARRWDNIQQHSRRLQDANVHNGLLLQHQIRYTENALEVLKPHQTQAFYGPDGKGKGQATLSRKA